MNSLGKRGIDRQAYRACERYLYEMNDEIYYEVYTEVAPDIMRQTLAVMLYALSLHGYGGKRLAQVLTWTQEVLSLGEVLGRQSSCEDCVAVLRKRYGIELAGVRPNLVPFEEYKRGCKRERKRP